MMVRNKPHRGILIDQIPVDGFAGFLFMVGVLVTLLVGIPALREFLLIGLPVGLAFGLSLYFWRRQTRW